MFKLRGEGRRKILYFLKRFFVAEGEQSEGKIKMNSNCALAQPMKMHNIFSSAEIDKV
jgi:hypothetical protein